MAALATTGTVAARPRGRAAAPTHDQHAAFLRRRRIAERDDMTLKRMRPHLRAEHGLKVGVGTLWSVRNAGELTYKGYSFLHRADCSDVRAAGEAWFMAPNERPSRSKNRRHASTVHSVEANSLGCTKPPHVLKTMRSLSLGLMSK